MKTIAQIRYENLEKLVMKAAGPGGDLKKGLTNLVDMARNNNKKLSRPNLYQILTRKETAGGAVRGIGDKTARLLEDALKLPRGAMDAQDGKQSQAAAIDPLTMEIAEIIATYWKTNEQGRRLIMAAAEAARSSGSSHATSNNEFQDRR